MKTIHNAIALLFVLIPLFATAQQPVMQRLGNWLPDTVALSGSAQGLAIHRNQAVMLRHGGQCLLLDMKQHRLIASYMLDGNTTHCNNASFSSLRHYGDTFPLLYISGCYGDKACYVTRLTRHGSTIVQRIYYDSDCFPVAQDWCLDADSNLLYAYGGRKGGPMFLKQFRLPSPTTPEVHLTDADVLRTIPVNCVSVAQGSKIKNGYAYLPDGDRPGHFWLHIISLASGQEVRTIDLNPIGLEPEGIDIRDGWIYISFNTADPHDNPIYRFPDISH